jgi:hypothetical protein
MEYPIHTPSIVIQIHDNIILMKSFLLMYVRKLPEDGLIMTETCLEIYDPKNAIRVILMVFEADS